MKCLKLLLILSMMTGCTASLVGFDYENRVGMVKYLSNGADSIIEKRIADANEKMTLQCNGSYKIVKQMTESQYAGSIANTNSYANTETNSNSYIRPSGNNFYGSYNENSNTNFSGTTTSTAMYQEFTYLYFRCL